MSTQEVIVPAETSEASETLVVDEKLERKRLKKEKKLEFQKLRLAKLDNKKYKKLYYSTRRNNKISLFICFLLFLFVAFLNLCSYMYIWQSNKLIQWDTLQIFYDWLDTGTTDSTNKWIITSIFGFFLLGIFFKFLSKRSISKKFKKEFKYYKKTGFFPTEISDFIVKRLANLYIIKNNIYWLVFLICTACVITMIYLLVYSGVMYLIYGSTAEYSNSYVEFFSAQTYLKLFKNNPYKLLNTAEDISFKERPVRIFLWLCFAMAASIVAGIILSFFAKMKVRKIAKIYKYDEFNGNNELRERIHRKEKRNKHLLLVFTSIYGIFIYFLFKKLILAIYNKSFANKGSIS